jgi:hypothetical protein
MTRDDLLKTLYGLYVLCLNMGGILCQRDHQTERDHDNQDALSLDRASSSFVSASRHEGCYVIWQGSHNPHRSSRQLAKIPISFIDPKIGNFSMSAIAVNNR